MKLLFSYFSLILIFGCGGIEDETAGCREHIEAELWQKAIDCYESGEYSDQPEAGLEAEDYLYLLQWAGSYGGKYGLVGADIIEGALGDEESGDLPLDLTTKIDALVAEDRLSTAISELQKAIALIRTYPTKYRSSSSDDAVYFASDISVISLLFTSFLVEMQKREFEIALESGSLSAEQLISKADDVLETLINSGEIIGDPDLISAIDEQLSQINSQPGGNNAEKLDEFLSSQG